MEIIIGIVLLFIAIGLVVTLLKYLFYAIVFILVILWKLFKLSLYVLIPAGILYGFYYLYTVIGYWSIAIFAVCGLIVTAIVYFKPESTGQKVKRIFLDIEMATMDELHEKLRLEGPMDRSEMRRAVQHFVDTGKLEVLDFKGKERVYRWTDEREYPNGVITKHIRLD